MDEQFICEGCEQERDLMKGCEGCNRELCEWCYAAHRSPDAIDGYCRNLMVD
jgi:hypothetical protein